VGGQPKVVYPVSMKPSQGKAADFEKRSDMWKMMLQVKAPVAETARGSVPGVPSPVSTQKGEISLAFPQVGLVSS
jgi:hypothetical protein